MRVAIVGSREYPRSYTVRDFVARLARKYPDCVVVSGGARGVDTWAVEAAREAGLATEVLPADWVTYGKVAGYMRNQELIETLHEGDVLVAFHDGVSRGTMHTVGLAKAAGLRVYVYGPDMSRK